MGHEIIAAKSDSVLRIEIHTTHVGAGLTAFGAFHSVHKLGLLRRVVEAQFASARDAIGQVHAGHGHHNGGVFLTNDTSRMVMIRRAAVQTHVVLQIVLGWQLHTLVKCHSGARSARLLLLLLLGDCSLLLLLIVCLFAVERSPHCLELLVKNEIRLFHHQFLSCQNILVSIPACARLLQESLDFIQASIVVDWFGNLVVVAVCRCVTTCDNVVVSMRRGIVTINTISISRH